MQKIYSNKLSHYLKIIECLQVKLYCTILENILPWQISVIFFLFIFNDNNKIHNNKAMALQRL